MRMMAGASRHVKRGDTGAHNQLMNGVERPSRLRQQRGNLFPFRSEQQARRARPEVA
jgi:hypothetical protein